MRMYKKIILGVIVVTILAFAFWYGGDAPGLRGWTPQPKETSTTVQNSKPQKQDDAPEPMAKNIAIADKTSESRPSSEGKIGISDIEKKDKYRTEPIPQGKPLPVEPENSVITDKKFTCTLSVRCDTILKNISWLDSEKVDIVPKDGVIFAETTVTFYEGESVFNLLCREMKLNKLHIEFKNTPIYNSAYIQAIANLYEFDCGERSGWMYKVNGWFPNYGCSRYLLKAGDKVEWVYTCDLGIDIGASYYERNGN